MKRTLSLLAFAGVALGALTVIYAVAGYDTLSTVTFEQPWWMLAALLPIAAVMWRGWRHDAPATLRFSRLRTLRRVRGGWAGHLAELPDGLRLAAAVLLALSLGRPQSTRGTDRIIHEGIDIVMVLDLSESMRATDIFPNRLTAAKAVVADFIARRPHDRIGLVVFGSTASTVSPLTMDHGVLQAMVERLRLGVLPGDTTAIGAGLGVALNRLQDAADESADKPESQVIVLLTDGVQTAEGGLTPDTAAAAAADRGVRVYTVLMGADFGVAGESVDPAQLEKIATKTGGFAYKAADQHALVGSFQDILDELERSSIEGNLVRAELFLWLLGPALLFLMLDIGLRTTRLRRFP